MIGSLDSVANMFPSLSLDIMVVGLFAFCSTIVLLVVGFLLMLIQGRSPQAAPPSDKPLDQINRGLARLVEEADWLEGDKLNDAVRAVARAKDAVAEAARICGRSGHGFKVPQPLSRALEEDVQMLRGSSSVITFTCEDCSKEVTAMLQFPKVGGRPETTDPVAISARSDWREQGFSASTACKRCQKLLKKKFLYDSPSPVRE